MALIKGLHHAALNGTSKEEMERAAAFYTDVLGLKAERRSEEIIMVDTGCGIVEIFANDEQELPKGVVKHFAFAVDDTDACVKAVTEAGYEVFDGPRDVLIPFDPPVPARIAFMKGPLGEEIEFFQEKEPE